MKPVKRHFQILLTRFRKHVYGHENWPLMVTTKATTEYTPGREKGEPAMNFRCEIFNIESALTWLAEGPNAKLPSTMSRLPPRRTRNSWLGLRNRIISKAAYVLTLSHLNAIHKTFQKIHQNPKEDQPENLTTYLFPDTFLVFLSLDQIRAPS